MFIKNKVFKERPDLTSKIPDNEKNVFKVTYFKEYGKYYTEEFYELLNNDTYMFDLVEAFEKYVTNYSGMHAVIECHFDYFNSYPLMIPACKRKYGK